MSSIQEKQSLAWRSAVPREQWDARRDLGQE